MLAFCGGDPECGSDLVQLSSQSMSFLDVIPPACQDWPLDAPFCRCELTEPDSPEALMFVRATEPCATRRRTHLGM
jgi:hypothetical protein